MFAINWSETLSLALLMFVVADAGDWVSVGLSGEGQDPAELRQPLVWPVP